MGADFQFNFSSLDMGEDFGEGETFSIAERDFIRRAKISNAPVLYANALKMATLLSENRSFFRKV